MHASFWGRHCHHRFWSSVSSGGRGHGIGVESSGSLLRISARRLGREDSSNGPGLLFVRDALSLDQLSTFTDAPQDLVARCKSSRDFACCRVAFDMALSARASVIASPLSYGDIKF